MVDGANDALVGVDCCDADALGCQKDAQWQPNVPGTDYRNVNRFALSARRWLHWSDYRRSAKVAPVPPLIVLANPVTGQDYLVTQPEPADQRRELHDRRS